VSNGRSSRAPAAPSSEPPPPADDADADPQIREALSGGDTRRALALSVERYALCIGRLCMARLGSQSDADEATLETFLGAYRHFGELGDDSSVRAWLLGIARQTCLSQVEQIRRSRTGPHPHPHAGPEADEARAARRAERARALVERVRPSDRDALLLRYVVDVSFPEAALACGLDPVTTRKRVSRALVRLSSVLEGADDDD
jgi:RNA polymerase sigma-70 factor, ECF subfamily